MTEFGKRFALRDLSLTLAQSLYFDKEDMLEAMLQTIRKAHGLTPEEFARDWIIEEYPVEIQGEFSDEYIFKVRQNFRIRLKSEDELQIAIQNKEKSDVDPEEH